MLSSSRKHPLSIIAIGLLALSCIALAQDDLDVLPIDRNANTDLPIPPRPQQPVLDNAHFLSAEMLRAMNDSLSADARDFGLHVYVLTVPSLPKKTLESFTQRVAAEWTKGLFGAVIVFDDGTGIVAIEKSEAVSKRFYEFEITALLKDSMRSDKRPRLSRDGLKHTTTSMSNALKELKLRADREDTESFYTKIGVAGFAIMAILTLGTLQYFRNRPADNFPRSVGSRTLL